jgi:pimeloyl-ACP methyl ester carboxylesterase
MNKLRKYWWLIAIGMLVVAIIVFIAWAVLIPSPMPQALNSLQSDSQVNVTEQPWLVFQPVQNIPTTGLLFYPGGRVDPRAYAPSAYTLAAKGYLVVIVPMPLNLAVLGVNRASSVIQHFVDVQRWVIAGHSLGGSMAALFAYNHPNQIKGLVLWASYPASSNNLSDSAIKVTSIYATLDGLATLEKIEASRQLLPLDTTWIPIVGGNHAQFGWYGEQAGDNPAAISRERQQELVIAATLDLLQRVDQMQEK